MIKEFVISISIFLYFSLFSFVLSRKVGKETSKEERESAQRRSCAILRDKARINLASVPSWLWEQSGGNYHAVSLFCDFANLTGSFTQIRREVSSVFDFLTPRVFPTEMFTYYYTTREVKPPPSWCDIKDLFPVSMRIRRGREERILYIYIYMLFLYPS